jgi:hypothetical protein
MQHDCAQYKLTTTAYAQIYKLQKQGNVCNSGIFFNVMAYDIKKKFKQRIFVIKDLLQVLNIWKSLLSKYRHSLEKWYQLYVFYLCNRC